MLSAPNRAPIMTAQDDERTAVPQWFVEAQRGQFKPGDEVTVTLNGECHRGVLHGEQEIGARGLVISVDGNNGREPRGHTIWVHYRHPLPVVGTSSYYTPGELKPFDIMALIEEIAGALPPSDAR